MSAARLVLRYGPYPGQEFILPQQTVTIGREPVNELKLADPEISRRHARILYQAGRYLLEDLGSTNGTFVNGQRINAPTVLRTGDAIDFAEYVGFTFIGETGSLSDTLLEAPARGAAPPPAASPPPAAAALPVTQTQADSLLPARSAGYEPGPAPSRRWTRMQILAGCGCLVFLLIFLCTATIFLLDTLVSDFLYCQLLRPLFELLNIALACP
jgi:hypothetical protein